MDKKIIVHLCIDSKILEVPYNEKILVEDVIIFVCKYHSIGPLARHLFSLRIHNSELWLPLNMLLQGKSNQYDFRIRYKVASLNRLKKIDNKAYTYYFHQAKNDVLLNRIPDITYETYKRELLGLGVSDMYRSMLENKLSRRTVEYDYKKFFPKGLIKHYKVFMKKPVCDALQQIERLGYDALFVIGEYLKQLETMAPEYLSEEYRALLSFNGELRHVMIRISPFNCEFPGIRIYDISKKEWEQLAAIEDLCYISIRSDITVEISRKSGIPINLKFDSEPIMNSFVSLLDGYYRLMCKWTFNLCKDMTTPTLKYLYALKCHGPVGGEFSYAKLEEKRSNKPGCFILRECEKKYNVFYIDVCPKNCSKPKTYKIEKLNDGEYIINDDVTRYNSINAIISAYNKPDSSIYLHECLPPSEYDKSSLLLCLTDSFSTDALADSESVASTLNSNPVCINCENLQVYKDSRKESLNGMTVTYRCMWKLAKGKKMEVAMKVLKQEFYDKNLKDFMERAGDWAGLRRDGSSPGLVRLWGVTLGRQSALVLEYSRLGSLTNYLQKRKNMEDSNAIQTVDLIEASSHLASALWHLEEHGIIHGKIRCRKILVFVHDDNSFLVKLADPSMHTPSNKVVKNEFKEIHWIPVECYSNFSHRTFAGDVWAFGTTLWEIFRYGEEPPLGKQPDVVQMFYTEGRRLPKPNGCPDDIYQVMLECWNADPHRRKKPQAIMRDINQLLYQVFNSRRKHPYATVFSKSYSDTSSISTTFTEDTTISQREEPVSLITTTENNLSFSSNFCGGSISSTWNLSNSQFFEDYENDENPASCDISNIFSNLNLEDTLVDDINIFPSIFAIDPESNLILQGRIGQGFYGEVYKGTLERISDKDSEPIIVAVKKLKTSALSSGIQDFEREISIMKTLTHPNIVKILTVLDDPEVSLIMEYVPHGSLQSYLKIYQESLTTNQLLKYASDVALGMDYLSKKHIVHRDLATRNILVVDENHVKISDFGLAQVVGKNEEYYILRTNRDLPIKWYAPESLRDGKFSTRSDVWSYGVTMYEMFSYGEEPKLPMIENENEGSEQQNFLNALEKGARFACPKKCSHSIYVRIMYPCWESIPSERPTFSQLHFDINDLLQQQW